MKPATPLEIGQYMRKVRLTAGMSIQEVANIMKITRQTVMDWEKGKRLPRVDVYVQIMCVYGEDEFLTDK